MSQQWYRPLGESMPQPLLAPAAGYRLTDSGGPRRGLVDAWLRQKGSSHD
jgi:hypothetical protein